VVFAAAAAQIASAGHAVLCVAQTFAPPPADASQLRQPDRVPAACCELSLERAEFVINGGDTLLWRLH
jgi:hypothetical protein